MNMNWRTGFLVAIWFLVGVIIFVITKDWQIVAAIGTWLLAGGLIFAILQVRQMGKNTNAQVAVELFKELRKEEILKTLRKIYRRKPTDLKRLLNISTEEENKEDATLRDDIEKVTDNLELLGALVAQEIFDTKIAIEAYSGSTVLRCWYKLKEYIEEVRKQRGGLYCKYLEDFAWRTWDYQSRKSPQEKHIRFYEDIPSESFDLIQYLNDHPELQPNKQT